ncbi:MAG: DsbA family protein [Ilumatobacteraceae bacterium]
MTGVPRSFALTYDYRCPFARLVHDHVVEGLRAGADWDVTFLPFCLGQAHVEDGMPDVWDDPDADSGLLALQLSIAVRDAQPGVFPDVHQALFTHRHVGGGSLRDRKVLSALLVDNGADAEAAFADVESGRTLGVVRDEHESYVRSHSVWGTPTFVVRDSAIFVRLLDHAHGDGLLARRTIERILDDIDWPILNEFKHTTVPM